MDKNIIALVAAMVIVAVAGVTASVYDNNLARKCRLDVVTTHKQLTTDEAIHMSNWVCANG